MLGSPWLKDGKIRHRLALAVLANLCASSQLSGLTVGAAWLPDLLGLPPQAPGWFLGAFLLGALCTAPLAGFIVARLGPRQTLWYGLLLSLICNLLLAAEPGLVPELLGIFLLGAVLAPLPPSTQAMIDEEFPDDPGLRGLSTTLWSCGTTAGALWGALAGGMALDRWGWIGLCLLSVPTAGTALVLLAKLPFSQREAPATTCWRQLVLLPLIFASAGLVVNAGPELGWFHSAGIRTAAVVCSVAILLFVQANRKAPEAVLDFRLASHRSLGWAIFLALGVAAFSTGQLETLFLGAVDNYTSRDLGIRGGLGGLALVCGSATGGWLASRLGYMKGASVGLLVLCLGKCGFLFYRPEISLWQAFWPAIVSSVGYGILGTTISLLAFSDPRCRGAGAAGLLYLAWQFGDAFGLPLLMALYQHQDPVRGAVGAYQLVFRVELIATVALGLLCAAAARKFPSEDSVLAP